MSQGNRLAREASPYLRQHAQNPVDWYPWGEEAFARARAEDKPVLLSIGYASCHWCHVMARESFEDPKVAAYMNDHFVSIKVDREERPDVDAVYMAAVQALTDQGGWPLTVALTSEGEPFYGGTYFPTEDRHGLPSFIHVLEAVVEAWQERRPQVARTAQGLVDSLELMGSPLGPGLRGVAAASVAERAYKALAETEDMTNGGFGRAPKFPPHEAVRLLLAGGGEAELGMALRTLRALARSGLRDQLGGGFARYAVDEAWRVPHFEMMLYDNAAMLRNYAVAAARTGERTLHDAALGVASFLRRELGFELPGGAVAFNSALDADQEGGEGAYYAWSEEEFWNVTGEDAGLASAYFGASGESPFGGGYVLYQAASVEGLAGRFGLSVQECEARLEAAKARLFEARAARPAPAVDDKVLASWNGLTLGALATAGRLLAEPELVRLASANAAFLREHLWDGERLWHMWRGGERSVEGLLEDYAFVGCGLLDLYRATLKAEHLEWALALADRVSERFHDEAGGYFSTAADGEELIVRPKGYVDGATPSENCMAAELVWRAARYRDDRAAADTALAALSGVESPVMRAPRTFASSLRVRLLMEATPKEFVIAGAPGDPRTEALLEAWGRYDDGSALVLALDAHEDWRSALPLAEGRVPGSADAEPTAYVCSGGACRLPARTPAVLAEQLEAAGYAPVDNVS